MATYFYEAEFERNLKGKLSSKSIVRSTLIKTAAVLRMDELALALRRWPMNGGQSRTILAVENMLKPLFQRAGVRRREFSDKMPDLLRKSGTRLPI
jgi:hypothetical protein